MKTNTTIRNCEIKFRRQCPLKWETLQTLGEPNVKMCGVCQRQVFFCISDEETLLHAEQGHCIARQIPDSSMLPHVVLGEPAVMEVPTQEQEEARQLHLRERDITDTLNNIKHTSRRCVNCGYPFPRWWKQCRVCKGTEYQTVETQA